MQRRLGGVSSSLQRGDALLIGLGLRRVGGGVVVGCLRLLELGAGCLDVGLALGLDYAGLLNGGVVLGGRRTELALGDLQRGLLHGDIRLGVVHVLRGDEALLVEAVIRLYLAWALSRLA